MLLYLIWIIQYFYRFLCIFNLYLIHQRAPVTDLYPVETTPPWNEHSTWKIGLPQKESSLPTIHFSAAMLVSGRVCHDVLPFSPGRSETKIWTPGRAPTVAGRSKKATKLNNVRCVGDGFDRFWSEICWWLKQWETWKHLLYFIWKVYSP